jgi:hypothetical protein
MALMLASINIETGSSRKVKVIKENTILLLGKKSANLGTRVVWG